MQFVAVVAVKITERTRKPPFPKSFSLFNAHHFAKNGYFKVYWPLAVGTGYGFWVSEKLELG